MLGQVSGSRTNPQLPAGSSYTLPESTTSCCFVCGSKALHLITCPAPHRDWSHTFGTTAVNIWIAGAASSSELPLRSSPPSQYSTPPFLSSLCICLPPFPEPSSSLSIVMKMSGWQTRSSPAQYELLTDPLENASRSLFSFS